MTHLDRNVNNFAICTTDMDEFQCPSNEYADELLNEEQLLGPTQKITQADYASNVGDYQAVTGRIINDTGAGMDPTIDVDNDCRSDYPLFGNLFWQPGGQRCGGSPGQANPVFSKPQQCRGAIGRFGWSASFKHITDGTSKTFAVGECIGAWSVVQNFATQSFAITAHPINTGNAQMLGGGPSVWPNPNTSPEWGLSATFRSMHPGGAQFVMCDGSVTFIEDNIDQFTYMAFGSRAGPEVSEF